MAIHVARIGMVDIDPMGAVINKNAAKIKDMLTASSEQRVLVNAAIPNTTGNPTIEAYLIAEAGAGYKFAHLDQTFVITQS